MGDQDRVDLTLQELRLWETAGHLIDALRNVMRVGRKIKGTAIKKGLDFSCDMRYTFSSENKVSGGVRCPA